MSNKSNITVQFTKSGRPALWECGGGWSNTGSATIVCAPDGAPMRPYYVRTRGSLACSEHALLPADKGVVVVQASHHRRDFGIDVYRIVEQAQQAPGETQAVVATERLASFSENEWDRPDVADRYKAAIEAARAKAVSYHCRSPYYALGLAAPIKMDVPAAPPRPEPVPAPEPAPAPDPVPAQPSSTSAFFGRTRVEVTDTSIILIAPLVERYFKLDAAGVVEMLDYVLTSGYFSTSE